MLFFAVCMVVPTIEYIQTAKKSMLVPTREGWGGLSSGCGSMCMVVPTIEYIQTAKKSMLVPTCFFLLSVCIQLWVLPYTCSHTHLITHPILPSWVPTCFFLLSVCIQL